MIPPPAHINSDAWLLGDQVATVLNAAGVTKERVSAVLGRPCHCQDRQNKLNRISRAVQKWWRGEKDQAEDAIRRMVE